MTRRWLRVWFGWCVTEDRGRVQNRHPVWWGSVCSVTHLKPNSTCSLTVLCHFLAVLIPRYRANEREGGLSLSLKCTHTPTPTPHPRYTYTHTQDGFLELFFDYMLHYSQLGASSYAFSEVYRAKHPPIKLIFRHILEFLSAAPGVKRSRGQQASIATDQFWT